MLFNSMKTLNLFFVFAGMMLLFSLTFGSCDMDDEAYSLDDMWLSVATARPLDENSFYFTLDDSTSLWPVAPLHIYYKPDRPQRVQINYTVLSDNFNGYDHAIKLNRIDTILTKQIAENKGEENDAIYGNDPVKIVAMWVGDGFLNVHFKAYFSGRFKHFINLIRNETGDDEAAFYNVELRHNAFNDESSHLTNGFVAFDLSEINTQAKDVTLRIKVKTFDGVKEFEKKYNSGRNTETEPELNIDKISLEYME
jgi:hypothetical protein